MGQVWIIDGVRTPRARPPSVNQIFTMLSLVIRYQVESSDRYRHDGEGGKCLYKPAVVSISTR